jgi:hypothetical protein
MTYTEDLLRLYEARIIAMEQKIAELEAKLEISQNNYYAK